MFFISISVLLIDLSFSISHAACRYRRPGGPTFSGNLEKGSLTSYMIAFFPGKMEM